MNETTKNETIKMAGDGWQQYPSPITNYSPSSTSAANERIPDTIYLITGANRGIGLELTKTLIQRPRTTIIATARSPVTNLEGLMALKPFMHSTSGILIVQLEVGPDCDLSAANALNCLHRNYPLITHIDVVIANAGIGKDFSSVLTTPMSFMRENFEVNTLGPIKLYQATYDMLMNSYREPKFILISSALGSIGGTSGMEPSLAYGISKAGANFAIRKIHVEDPRTVTKAIHPGWVKTANGQHFADAIGLPEPPLDLATCAAGILAQIDTTSKANSGIFVDYQGNILPW